MNFLKKWFVAIVLLIAPSRIGRLIANAAGQRIAPTSRIGFSILLCDRIEMGSESRIGHLSFVAVPRLHMARKARIGHLNVCSGPFHIWLRRFAMIGNRNLITRSGAKIAVGLTLSMFKLGTWSKVTASHAVDLTSDVRFGNYSTLAGKGSQVWTHGYVHERTGLGRYRVDGAVLLGNNVYIGSGAMVTGGVRIADGISVGAGATVASDLNEVGFYVSERLRRLEPPPPPETRSDLMIVPDAGETVYRKRDDRYGPEESAD